jgi:phosphohistidine phosphatase
MRLVIVRHGKAEADSPTGRDEDRRLKKRGERQAQWLGEQFAKEPPALILSSSHQRAISTARFIQNATGSPLTFERRLELGHSVSQAIDAVVDHRPADGGPLMIVGHNPQLAQVVWVLLQGPPVQQVDLRTGEAVVVDVDPGNGLGTAKLVARLRMSEED